MAPLSLLDEKRVDQLHHVELRVFHSVDLIKCSYEIKPTANEMVSNEMVHAYKIFLALFS